MLTLTREVGETLTIGDNVTVKVLGMNGGQIRIGIDAPRDIKIDREECVASEKLEIQFEYRKAS